MREPDPDRWLAALEDREAERQKQIDDEEQDDEEDELDNVNEDAGEDR